MFCIQSIQERNFEKILAHAGGWPFALTGWVEREKGDGGGGGGVPDTWIVVSNLLLRTETSPHVIHDLNMVLQLSFCTWDTTQKEGHLQRPSETWLWDRVYPCSPVLGPLEAILDLLLTINNPGYCQQFSLDLYYPHLTTLQL